MLDDTVDDDGAGELRSNDEATLLPTLEDSEFSRGFVRSFMAVVVGADGRTIVSHKMFGMRFGCDDANSLDFD